MRNLLTFCSRPDRFAVAAPEWGRVGTWARRPFGEREFPYFRLGTEAVGGSRRLATALHLFKEAPVLGSFRTVYSHGPELLLPLLLRGYRGRLVLHVLGDLESEPRYSANPFLRATGSFAGYRRLAEMVMRRCDRVLWVDGTQIDRLPPSLAAKSEVVSTFFDPALFHPDGGPPPREGPVLLTVSRLSPVKRIELILETLARNPDWRVVVCGQGEEEAKLRAVANRLGVSDRVDWIVDFLPPAELAKLMRRADVGLLVSAAEGSPSVVKEMLACALPVVASDVGDLSLFVREGVNGALLSDVTPEAIEEGVRRLLSLSPEARHEIPGTVRRYEVASVIAKLEEALLA